MGTLFEDCAHHQRWFGLGVMLALLWGVRASLFTAWTFGREHSAVNDRRAELWICDRDASALIGLDAEGLRCARIQVPYPVELEPGGDGWLWVLYQLDVGPSAERRLCSISLDGRLRLDLPAPGLREIVACERGALAGVIEEATQARLVSFDSSGLRRELGAVELGAHLARGLDDRLWLAGPSQLTCASESAGQLRVVRELSTARTRQISAWSPQGTWMIERSKEGELRLVRLDGEGRPLFEVPASYLRLGTGPVFLASEAGLGVWLVTERGEALRLDDAGNYLARGNLPMLGIEAACMAPDGGLLAVSGGSLMRLDPQAASAAGQGGFGYVSDFFLVGTTR